MKRYFILIYLIVSTTIAFSKVQEINFCTGVNWYPYYLQNNDGSFYGAAIDILSEIGKREGFKVKILGDIPWKRQLFMLDRGQLDLIGAVYYTEERSKKYLYTEPYSKDQARIFTLKDSKIKFNKLEDLIGYEGGRPLAGSYGDEFDLYAKKHLSFQYARSKKILVRMLLYKRIDYLVFSYWDLLAYLKEQKLDDKIIALPKPVTTTKVYFMFSKKSKMTHLIPKINSQIISMKRKGEIKIILDKY